MPGPSELCVLNNSRWASRVFWSDPNCCKFWMGCTISNDAIWDLESWPVLVNPTDGWSWLIIHCQSRGWFRDTFNILWVLCSIDHTKTAIQIWVRVRKFPLMSKSCGLGDESVNIATPKVRIMDLRLVTTSFRSLLRNILRFSCCIRHGRQQISPAGKDCPDILWSNREQLGTNTQH